MEVFKNDLGSLSFLSGKNKNNSGFCCLYKNKQQSLYLDMKKLMIILKIKGGEAKELSFIEFVRFIDTRSEKNPEWKRDKILFTASKLGFFGI